jgi:hypothetical protein
MTQFTCKGVKQINNRISLNMTFTFTIRISRRFSSAREFQMGNFQTKQIKVLFKDYKFQDGIDKPQKCRNVCYHPKHQQQSDFLIFSAL